MPVSVTNNNNNHIDAIEKQLESPSDAEFQFGLDEAQEILLEDAANEAVITLLVTVGEQATPNRRAQIIDRLKVIESEQAKAAVERLTGAGSAANDDDQVNTLRQEAFNAHYDGDYRRAKELFEAYLQERPDDLEARRQLEKVRIRMVGEEIPSARQPSAGGSIPRQAWQLYRRARSYLAAGASKSAQKLIEEAVTLAEQNNAVFSEAEDLLGSLENHLVLAEFKEKAEKALEEEQWEEALQQYRYAHQLDPEDDDIRGSYRALADLLKAQSILATLRVDPEGIANVADSLAELQETIMLATEIRLLSPLAQAVARDLKPFKEELAARQSERGMKLAAEGDRATSLTQKEYWYASSLAAFETARSLGEAIDNQGQTEVGDKLEEVRNVLSEHEENFPDSVDKTAVKAWLRVAPKDPKVQQAARQIGDKAVENARQSMSSPWKWSFYSEAARTLKEARQFLGDTSEIRQLEAQLAKQRRLVYGIGYAIILILLIGVTLFSYSGYQAYQLSLMPTVTPTPSNTPTITPTLTPSVTPSPTNTATPTLTP